MLNEREKYWISYYRIQCPEKVMNIQDGGTGGDTWSKHPRRHEFCARMSYLWTVNNPNKEGLRPEQKAKMIASKTGVPIHSEEYKKMLSIRVKWEWELGLRNKEKCREQARQMGFLKKGSRLTEEHKKKVSESLLKSEAHRLGRIKTAETKKARRLVKVNALCEYLKSHSQREAMDHFKMSRSAFYRYKSNASNASK